MYLSIIDPKPCSIYLRGTIKVLASLNGGDGLRRLEAQGFGSRGANYIVWKVIALLSELPQ